jgi:hypothetical protein
MKRIDTFKLENGLLVCGRNNKSVEGKVIRWGVHSFWNHNAMVVKHDGDWGIAEAVVPVSKVSTIHHYEKIMNEDDYMVRFYRHKRLTGGEQTLAAMYFTTKLLGLKYPRKSRMLLLGMPIYNAIVDKTKIIPPMRLTWCSQLVMLAYEWAKRGCTDRFDGKKKKLFTPRTFWNRIAEGMFEDVTDEIVYDE